MPISKDLKKIKNVYGEEFMHLCRELFPTILEQDGRLFEILNSSFSDNCKDLSQAIISNGLEGKFKNYIYSKADVEPADKKIIEIRTPYEILDEAGYTLYECKTEDEIQTFRKYYAPGEELCTFNGGRLNRCVVFFAVKKDVEAEFGMLRKDDFISPVRENFTSPKREDEYGTSVMGIQFSRGAKTTVSIKNRYNHTVNNPDATYGNDLDRIAPGLEKSFEELLKERGLYLNVSNIEEIEIPGYVVANDGKFYKMNFESNGIYYCPKNIVIDGGTVQVVGELEKKILIDHFVLDFEKKKIEQYDGRLHHDSFVDALQNIERIEITKNNEKKTKKINLSIRSQDTPVIIEVNANNEIVGYTNENLVSVGDNFLFNNRSLNELNIPNLQSIGNDFLRSNQSLKKFNSPNLQNLGDSFLFYNECLQEFTAPILQDIGCDFLFSNKSLKEFSAPKLQSVGERFYIF